MLIFTAITVLVTILFDADVEAQGGAYATGVLVLMTSAARRRDACGARRGRHCVGFLLITLRVHLHDGRQHLRAAGRHQDRRVVHRDHHRDIARSRA